MIIGGERHRAVGGRTIQVVNPARPAEIVGEVAAGGATDADAAVAAARAALPGWRWGREAKTALTADPGVDEVSFTGSTATGVTVLESAARTIKRTSLELDGNDPCDHPGRRRRG